MNRTPEVSWSALHEQLTKLRGELLEAEQRASALLSEVHPALRASATNLVHYLSLREHDRGSLQRQLACLGLSSLGRSEAHVLATLDAVLAVVGTLRDRCAQPMSAESLLADCADRDALLHDHTVELLGPAHAQMTRIMVTLPSEAADDPDYVHALLSAGMNCARINAAHDDPAAWLRMVRHVRRASVESGIPCVVTVDLPGPKCRTGALQPGPKVLRLRPQRGPAGEVQSPARAWLTSTPGSAPAPALPVSAAFIESLRCGDELTLRDARGRRRRLRVGELRSQHAEVSCDRSVYVHEGALIRGAASECAVGPLPAVELPLRVHAGDVLALTRAATPGGPVRTPFPEEPRAHAQIPVEPGALVDMVRTDEAVWFDDGKIGGVVMHVSADAIFVRITVARPGGEKLRAEKGINLPDSDLSLLPAFTERDDQALAFAAQACDIAAMSFVRSPEDVRALQQRLASLGNPALGIILKIETRGSFARLPELLLAALRSPRVGVMIARGDLAVECGFERLAEVQEEILWLCEAAHVPVIWATQVLETLAKTGRPSRAEVTDAAMSSRAECVMLNKGPFIAQAVMLLGDILRRMSAHQDKKSALFRGLHVAAQFRQRLERQPDDDGSALI